MSFFIVTSTEIDFEMFSKRASQDQGPRHALPEIADILDAKIYQPDNNETVLIDKILSNLAGEPMHWALARRLISILKDGDNVYCVSEATAIPLSILCKFFNRKPRIVVNLLAPNRTRVRYLIKIFGLDKVIQLFAALSKSKLDGLQRFLKLDDNRMVVFPEKSDERFFAPGEGQMVESSALIGSAGLEQRDYKVLAEAINGMDIDVKICDFSPNASTQTKVRMPESIPENMEIRYFEFSELRDLYRSANIVVVSLLDNDYAGITVLMEAMACCRPVIMTQTVGLPEELINKGLIIGVKPNDSEGLRKAIQDLLDNPVKAAELASKSHEYFLANHTMDNYVNSVSSVLLSLDKPLPGRNS